MPKMFEIRDQSPQLSAWPWTNHLTAPCPYFPISDGYNPTIHLLRHSKAYFSNVQSFANDVC